MVGDKFGISKVIWLGKSYYFEGAYEDGVSAAYYFCSGAYFY